MEDWDHEACRSRFEPREHWQLKEEFILAHKTTIQKDELVCLANVYVNMQLLGCRYPASVAARVRALSRGLGGSYRQWRLGKLKRTFVKASDAAVARIRRSDAPTTQGIQDDTAGAAEGEAADEGSVSAETKKKKKRKLQSETMNEEECEGSVGDVDDEIPNKTLKKKKKKKVTGTEHEEEMESVSSKRKLPEELVEDDSNLKKKKKKAADVEHEEEMESVSSKRKLSEELVEKKKKKKKKGTDLEHEDEEMESVSSKRKPSEELVQNGSDLSKKKKKKEKELYSTLESEHNQHSSEALEVLPKQRKSKLKDKRLCVEVDCVSEEERPAFNSSDVVEALSSKIRSRRKRPDDSTVEVGSDSAREERPAFGSSDAIERLSSKIKNRKLKANGSDVTDSAELGGADRNGMERETPAFNKASLMDESHPFHGLVFVKHDDRQCAARVLLNCFLPDGNYKAQENLHGDFIIASVRNIEVARLPLGITPISVVKEQVSRIALKALVKCCPLLVCKPESREPNVGVNGGLLSDGDPENNNPLADQGYTEEKVQRISKDNVGSKLLQLMGWTGGGLGRNETGRVDPVEAVMRNRGVGLGYEGSPSVGVSDDFKRKVDVLLDNFTRDFVTGSTELEELVFPSFFSKKQRECVHKKVEKRKQLKSASYGRGENRHLVVRPKMRHYMKALQVFEKGGETNMYTAHMPGTYDISVFNLSPL